MLNNSPYFPHVKEACSRNHNSADLEYNSSRIEGYNCEMRLETRLSGFLNGGEKEAMDNSPRMGNQICNHLINCQIYLKLTCVIASEGTKQILPARVYLLGSQQQTTGLCHMRKCLLVFSVTHSQSCEKRDCHSNDVGTKRHKAWISCQDVLRYY